ncbi:MAG: hypothetical protein V7633_1576 [Pseudonocardia sp.]
MNGPIQTRHPYRAQAAPSGPALPAGDQRSASCAGCDETIRNRGGRRAARLAASAALGRRGGRPQWWPARHRGGRIAIANITTQTNELNERTERAVEAIGRCGSRDLSATPWSA